MSLKFLLVIPARGGSKSIKNKNIIKIKNKTILDYTIRITQNIKDLNKVILSSDSKKILNVGKKYRNVHLHKRPDYLSTDKALTVDTIRHLLREEEKIGNNYDYVIVMAPTSPLRTKKHLLDCLSIVKNKRPDSLITISKLEKPLEWLLFKDKNGFLREYLGKGSAFGNRQNKTFFYFPNGAIFIIKTKLTKFNGYYFKNTVGYEMDFKSSIDIDTRKDLDLLKKFL